MVASSGMHREEVLAQDRRHGRDDGDIVWRDAQLLVGLPQRRRHVAGITGIAFSPRQGDLSWMSSRQQMGSHDLLPDLVKHSKADPHVARKRTGECGP